MTVKDFLMSLDRETLARRYGQDNWLPYTAAPGNEGISQEEAVRRLAAAALTFLDEVAKAEPVEKTRRVLYVLQPEDEEEDDCWLIPQVAESENEPPEDAAVLGARHWPEALGYLLGNALPDPYAQAAAIAVYLRYPGFSAG